MTFVVTFEIPGLPIAKGRPRFARRGKFISTYTPVKTKTYEDIVRACARAAMGASEPLETPVAAYIYINMPVPKTYSKQRTKDCLSGKEKHTKRPDADNIGKAITDAMNEIIYMDDSQIVELHIKKLYGEEPMVNVLVKEVLE